MGAAHAIPTPADEPLVRAVATVAGHYHDAAADRQWLGGGDPVAWRRARGQAALAVRRLSAEHRGGAGCRARDGQTRSPELWTRISSYR